MVCAPVWRDNPRALATGLSTVQAHGAQTMLYLTCTTISSVDLAQYGVLLAKWNVVQHLPVSHSQNVLFIIIFVCLLSKTRQSASARDKLLSGCSHIIKLGCQFQEKCIQYFLGHETSKCPILIVYAYRSGLSFAFPK